MSREDAYKYEDLLRCFPGLFSSLDDLKKNDLNGTGD